MFKLPPGITLDRAFVSDQPRVSRGYNLRARLGEVETVGLFGPLLDKDGQQIVLPGDDIYRSLFTTPSVITGQVLAASVSAVKLIDYDADSTPATGTRWKVGDLTPVAWVEASDLLPDPSTGRVEIPPVMWFADQDDLVVGQRANVAGEPCHYWDRDPAQPFKPLANSPTGAVAGGLINRILVLLGATSFTDPDPRRFMTIRWSDRGNFESWTPSDLNLSGELQLEGGSRIVGGGVTGFGVIAWTDRRMALLTETFDPDSVFQRRYVDGGRGMMANGAWCEADGQVFWFDESRTLNAFDGGRPRQIENPIKYATIERINDRQMARAYLVPNPEYGEIILHYPTGNGDNPDRQLVYNYVNQCWDIWAFTRTGWSPRFGVIHNLAVDPGGKVYRHDLDVSLGMPWIPSPVPFGADPHTVAADEVVPYNFLLDTNLITLEDPTDEGWHGTRVMIDHLPMTPDGVSDTFDVTLTGYGEPTLTAPSIAETQTYVAGGPPMDFRVGGKAVSIRIEGRGVKTVFHFGNVAVRMTKDHPR
jgi:hypothetical protein